MEGASCGAQTAELDAAILDINLGRSAIFPVADVLSEHGIRLIFAIGNGSKGVPPRFQNNSTLPKPFSYQSLEEALQAVLQAQSCYAEAA